MELPSGTLFSKIENTIHVVAPEEKFIKNMYFNSISVKHDTLFENGKRHDWVEMPIEWFRDSSHASLEYYIKEEVSINGISESIPLEDSFYEAWSRDGMFEKDDLFLVFEKDDLLQLRNIIDKGIEVSNV